MRKTILLAALALAMLAPASAAPFYPRPHEVNGRRDNQHDRIRQGLQSGTISQREAHKLRLEGRAIHREEQGMRAAHNGHLTRLDQHILNRQLNFRSRQIHHDRHD